MAEQESAQNQPREISGEEFLRMVREHGVYVRVSEADMKNGDVRKLIASLAAMRMSGAIPHFSAEIVL